jgi:hypothetical protein
VGSASTLCNKWLSLKGVITAYCCACGPGPLISCSLHERLKLRVGGSILDEYSVYGWNLPETTGYAPTEGIHPSAQQGLDGVYPCSQPCTVMLDMFLKVYQMRQRCSRQVQEEEQHNMHNQSSHQRQRTRRVAETAFAVDTLAASFPALFCMKSVTSLFLFYDYKSTVQLILHVSVELINWKAPVANGPASWSGTCPNSSTSCVSVDAAPFLCPIAASDCGTCS